MAEHVAGTEGEFVARMNQKAELLGMDIPPILWTVAD